MIPRKNPDVIFSTALDGDLVLLDVRSGEFLGMSGVALAVWDAIDGVRSLGDIQTLIAGCYDVDRATCFAEVAAFVEDLLRAKLIDVV